MMLWLLIMFLLFVGVLWLIWRAVGRTLPPPGSGPQRSGQERRAARDAMHNFLRGLGGGGGGTPG
jgi:hypothetical protein